MPRRALTALVLTMLVLGGCSTSRPIIGFDPDLHQKVYAYRVNPAKIWTKLGDFPGRKGLPVQITVTGQWRPNRKSHWLDASGIRVGKRKNPHQRGRNPLYLREGLNVFGGAIIPVGHEQQIVLQKDSALYVGYLLGPNAVQYQQVEGYLDVTITVLRP